MKAPISWIREYAPIPVEVTGRELAARLIDRGLEVETVYTLGEVSGPLVVARVKSIEELAEFKKPIRLCIVEVGDEHGAAGTSERQIICGATNFAVGDLVVAALPGAVLPGNFEIAARKTYGHTSDGMICSLRELELGEDHDGILILPPDAGQPGDDAVSLLHLGDEVIDIAVTPDRGYALSIRGLAREAAGVYGVEFREPIKVVSDRAIGNNQDGDAVGCGSESSELCDHFTTRTVVGVNAKAPTPMWMQQRLIAAGMRPISILVDIANYVMIESGQPLHTFDKDKLSGSLVARNARQGEILTTLDNVERTLDPDDLVIADDSGVIGLAGTMGGASTEITLDTESLVIEAAHFAPEVVGRMARRHKLPSEASRRFERGVDDLVCDGASQRAAELIVELAGGQVVGSASYSEEREQVTIPFNINRPSQVAGFGISPDQVQANLEEVGCTLSPELLAGQEGQVIAPSWRPDLTDSADLVEEVLRIVGYGAIPSTLPSVPSGRGLTASQQLRRQASKTLAAAGLVETLTYPFLGKAELEAAMLDSVPEFSQLVTLANPLSEEQPGLRSTLIPGLLAVARRNLSRGADAISIFETGLAFTPSAVKAVAPRPSVSGRPSDEELAQLDALLPAQVRHVAGIVSGPVQNPGWWGKSRTADWSDAVAIVRALASELAVELVVTQGEAPMFHPGRCAEFSVDGKVVGHAGELHPTVVKNWDLQVQTSVFEVDLDVLVAAAQPMRGAPEVGTMPVAKEDLALVVSEDVSAAELQAALVRGAGPLLESIRLFDVYRGDQLADGEKSLAFALRFRAEDRTLEVAEVSEARDLALAEATKAFGARLRQ